MFPKTISYSLVVVLAVSPAALSAESGPGVGADQAPRSFQVAQHAVPERAAGGQSSALPPPGDAAESPAAGIRELDIRPAHAKSDAEDLLSDPLFQQTVTLDFKGADIQNVIRLIAAKTGMNVLLDPGEVQGDITLHLENVPLGVALDNILRVQKLAYIVEPGNIVRIVPENKVGRDEVETQTQVIELNWRDAVDISKTFKPFLTTHGRIEAEGESQSVIITDVPPNILKIRELINRVDRPDRQVIIEAHLVDLNVSASKTLAAAWSASKLNTNHIQPTFTDQVPGIDPTTGDPITVDLDRPARSIAELLSTGAVGTIGGVSPVDVEGLAFAGGLGTLQFGSTVGILGDKYDLNASLTALENRGVVEVLASPRVTTLNNVVATIKTVQELPYIEGAVAGPGGNTAETIKYEEIGETIGVKPIITPDKHVRMDINLKQRIFRFRVGIREGSKGLEPPLIDLRDAKSTVIVMDGGTAVLGGLRKRESRDGVVGVPWLHRIPVIGWAFKNKNYDQTRTEMVLMITPSIVEEHVLTDREKELYDRIDVKWHMPDYMNDETVNEDSLVR